MKNAVMQQTRLAIFAPLAVAALVAVLITSGALAGKPGGGPSPTYSYTLVPIGLTRLEGMNNSGIVVGSYSTSDSYGRLYVVAPEDTNGNGRPDRWFRDTNGDGWNDLAIPLGVPSPAAAYEFTFFEAAVINDAGQIAGYYFGWAEDGETEVNGAFVINPTDVNDDGQREWFAPDGTGANALMIPLDLGSGLRLQSLAMNNRGQVVGVLHSAVDRGFLVDAIDANGDGVADTWFQDGNGDGINDLLVDLGAARDASGNLVPIEPAAINDAGQVVGGGPGPWLLIPRLDPSTGKRIWNEDANGDGVNDRVIMLPVLSNRGGGVNSINAAGVIVGGATTSKGAGHPIVWRRDAQGRVTLTDLDTTFADSTAACSINTSQQVVGAGYRNGGSSLTFLWQNGVMTDLLTLIQPSEIPSGSRMMTAQKINDAGLIFGLFWGPTGGGISQYFSYLAVPNSLLP